MAISNEKLMYERGVIVSHTSDEGSNYPDVGMSVGLGDGIMIYAGEDYNENGWCLKLYGLSVTDTKTLSRNINPEYAKDAIESISTAINKTTL